ncbi:MAG: glycosyltransferase family 2 protein [Anaerolineae bacterium]|nr:MAG: glycosyltransferase family 2 protein [Anaerolineae bacterium]
MFERKKIGVVVPAHNEELLIGRVIETMPDYVDRIYIVDDCSADQTQARVAVYLNDRKHKKRLRYIRLEENKGVGKAIVKGYRKAAEEGMDVVAVMAGDAQMDPDDLPAVLAPVVRGECDYTKGNRLFTGEAWETIPRYRYLGNATLSLFTKIASGYWHVADSQTGYTAISRAAIETMPLEKLYSRYGYPNHMLVMLNVFNMRVRDVPVKPVYNIGEKSGIKLRTVVPRISWLLLKTFLWRMKEKYIIRDFHPLVLFYGSALALMVGTLALGLRLLWRLWESGSAPPINTLAFMFTAITGVQFLLFAMWFDMDSNKHLR